MIDRTGDLFEDPTRPSTQAFLDAFESWLSVRELSGDIRERSSVAVYRSMWGALTAWCVSRCLDLHALKANHLEAFLHSRGGQDELTPRHAWRLLMLVDAVLGHHTGVKGQPHNSAARDLLMSTPQWRFANAADKTPLPDHLHASEARRLVTWLLDPASVADAAGAPAHTWQALRNRAAVGLQLGAGLTPGDIRAVTVDDVVCQGSRAPGLPWKISIPAHGGSPAREAPVAPWAGRLLRTWLDTRCVLQIAGPALFPSTRMGRAWGKVAQYGAARAVLAAAGVPDGEGGSFKLRHTFALRQLKRGCPPEHVAQWLGLSDINALRGYRRVLMAPADVI